MYTQIPRGLDHLRMLAELSNVTRQTSEPELSKHTEDLRIIGTSLSVLYEAATCHRRCHGGPHILESLVGRAYNLGCAAYILISRAFYDEALNLIRCLAEILNLILMSVWDKDSLRRWLSADRDTRLREFSPAKVRKLLENEALPGYADKDWYSKFCEDYVHINPATKPNLHNEKGRAYAGGVFQPEGLALALDELATVLGLVSLPVCKYFDFDDIFKELEELVRTDGSDMPAS